MNTAPLERSCFILFEPSAKVNNAAEVLKRIACKKRGLSRNDLEKCPSINSVGAALKTITDDWRIPILLGDSTETRALISMSRFIPESIDQEVVGRRHCTGLAESEIYRIEDKYLFDIERRLQSCGYRIRARNPAKEGQELLSGGSLR